MVYIKNILVYTIICVVILLTTYNLRVDAQQQQTPRFSCSVNGELVSCGYITGMPCDLHRELGCGAFSVTCTYSGGRGVPSIVKTGSEINSDSICSAEFQNLWGMPYAMYEMMWAWGGYNAMSCPDACNPTNYPALDHQWGCSDGNGGFTLNCCQLVNNNCFSNPQWQCLYRGVTPVANNLCPATVKPPCPSPPTCRYMYKCRGANNEILDCRCEDLQTSTALTCPPERLFELVCYDQNPPGGVASDQQLCNNGQPKPQPLHNDQSSPHGSIICPATSTTTSPSNCEHTFYDYRCRHPQTNQFVPCDCNVLQSALTYNCALSNDFDVICVDANDPTTTPVANWHCRDRPRPTSGGRDNGNKWACFTSPQDPLPHCPANYQWQCLDPVRSNVWTSCDCDALQLTLDDECPNIQSFSAACVNLGHPHAPRVANHYCSTAPLIDNKLPRGQYFGLSASLLCPQPTSPPRPTWCDANIACEVHGIKPHPITGLPTPITWTAFGEESCSCSALSTQGHQLMQFDFFNLTEEEYYHPLVGYTPDYPWARPIERCQNQSVTHFEFTQLCINGGNRSDPLPPEDCERRFNINLSSSQTIQCPCNQPTYNVMCRDFNNNLVDCDCTILRQSTGQPCPIQTDWDHVCVDLRTMQPAVPSYCPNMPTEQFHCGQCGIEVVGVYTLPNGEEWHGQPPGSCWSWQNNSHLSGQLPQRALIPGIAWSGSLIPEPQDWDETIHACPFADANGYYRVRGVCYDTRTGLFIDDPDNHPACQGYQQGIFASWAEAYQDCVCTSIVTPQYEVLCEDANRVFGSCDCARLTADGRHPFYPTQVCYPGNCFDITLGRPGQIVDDRYCQHLWALDPTIVARCPL